MRLHLSVDLPEDLALLPRLRRTIREALNLCRIAAEDVDELELVIGELATNAACHSGADRYQVCIVLADGQVITTVADTGAGFRRDVVPPRGTVRAGYNGEGRVGGWGLPLVELLSDEVAFVSAHPHGTTVRAVKNLRALP